MRFQTSALVGSAALALSVQGASVPDTRSFHVKQVPAGKSFKSGPISSWQTYQKYAFMGAVAPSYIKPAAAAAQSGSVTASPSQYDEEYLCPVTIGQQTLNLDFDTGSADLWVFSSLQPTTQSSGHTIYTPGSTAKKQSGETWKITYGDGSGASGVVYSDKVVIGGVTATSQAVEAATSASAAFVDNKPDSGLVGLSFSSLNTVTPNAATTFFDTVKSTLAAKLFTANLQKGEPGSYTFGVINSTQYTGKISYVPVDNSKGFWGFTAGAYSFTSAAPSGSIGSAIVDTGTTLFYLPATVAKAYYATVKGAKLNTAQGGWTFPCSSTLPDFDVKIGSTVYTVPGSYINYAPINNKGKVCFGGLQPDTGLPFSIFGDIFIKSQFIVFDQTQSTPRLGFASKPT